MKSQTVSRRSLTPMYIKKLVAEFEQLGNSFLEDDRKELYQRGTKDIMSSDDDDIMMMFYVQLKANTLRARNSFTNFETRDPLTEL